MNDNTILTHMVRQTLLRQFDEQDNALQNFYCREEGRAMILMPFSHFFHFCQNHTSLISTCEYVILTSVWAFVRTHRMIYFGGNVMKKILCVILAAVMVLSLAGCKDKNKADDPAQTPTEAVSTPAPTEEPTAAPADVSAKPTAEPTAEPEQPTAAVDYDAILEAYNNFLVDVYMEDHYDESFEEIKFAIGFVDEDDIPELFVSDGYYHACGTKVFMYIDGEVTLVGEFGEYGGFGFTPRKNNIYSFYYGMGVGSNAVYSMNPDGSTTQKGSFTFGDFYDYENDVDLGTKYYVNDEEVDEATYDKEIAQFYYDDVENWALAYDYNFASFSDTCYNRIDVMKYMVDEALAGRTFTRYITPEMEAMVGEWQLTRVDITDYINDVYGSYDSTVANSTIEITPDFRASYWLSAWVLDDGEDNLFYSDYYMPMTYFPMAIYDGVENDEYCIECVAEGDGYSEASRTYYLVMFKDDEGNDVLELAEFFGDYMDYEYEGTILAYYERSDIAEPKGELYYGILRDYPEGTRNDGTICYTLEQYIYLTPDSDPDLIAAYGFEPDLDGYDFEVVMTGEEPMVVYASQYGPTSDWPNTTGYRLLDYVDMMYKVVDAETFHDFVLGTYDGLYVSLYIEEGTDIANYIEEDYMG